MSIIMTPSQTVLMWLDVFAGIGTHLWFKAHEPESIAALLIPFLFTSSCVSAFWAAFVGVYNIWKAYLIYIGTILASITIYRLSPFHPLARYPGPILYRVSKIWPAFAAYQGKLHVYHQGFHEKYGPIVRVGPNELSIVNKEFIPLIYGSSGLPKGPLWEGRLATPSGKNILSYILINHHDTEGHAKLRKTWDKAFATGPLNDYMDILVPAASRLKEHLRALCESSSDGRAHIDFAKWMTFFSLDFVGDMAFGGGFNFMSEGDSDGLVRGLEAALAAGALTQHAPWLGHLLSAISFSKDRSKNFRLFAIKQAKQRFSEGVGKRDLLYHLLAATDSDTTADPFQSVSESVLTILAGSDTTATVLRNIMYYLLTRSYFLALRREVDDNFSFEEGVPIEFARLSSMKLLNAVINEALRLLPALSTSIQRAPVKGSGGIVLKDIFIPEGTGITITPYTLHRDPHYFYPRSDEFWPERWLASKREEKELILDRAAFIPFSYGPANCVGKSLAILELRYIIAMLVQQFDISLEQGLEAEMQKDGVGDPFILHAWPLPVIITVRSKSG